MWTLEDKFHISARPCMILYLSIILAWKLIEHRIIATEESIQFVIKNALIIKKKSIIALAIYNLFC